MTYFEAMMSGAIIGNNSENFKPVFEYLESQRDVIEPVLDDIFNKALETVDLESDGYLEELIERIISSIGLRMIANKKEITNHVVNMLNIEYAPDEIPEKPKLVRVK